jgi:cell wall-associated NlpC family hydrolase
MPTQPPVPHWSCGYVGLPYRPRAEGPDAYDCWGLVRAVLRDVFGVVVPIIQPPGYTISQFARQFAGHPERARWRTVEAPADGDIVLLSHGRQPHHCGVWAAVDGGLVLHAEDGVGVSAQRPGVLRAFGWSRFEYLRRDHV